MCWQYLPESRICLWSPETFVLAWTICNPTTMSWFLVSVSEDQCWHVTVVGIFHRILIICWQCRLRLSSFCSCTTGSSAMTWAFLLRLSETMSVHCCSFCCLWPFDRLNFSQCDISNGEQRSADHDSISHLFFDANDLWCTRASGATVSTSLQLPFLSCTTLLSVFSDAL